MSVTNPTSSYPVVHIAQSSDWDALIGLCDGHLHRPDLSRFRQALHQRCKTVVVEKEYICKDYRDTYTNFYAKKFASYPQKCTRLLFFSDQVMPDEWWNVASYAGSFLGYTVIRPTRIRCVGRTILNPTACAGVDGYMCLQDYRANLLGVPLTVKGFPYISQDTDVTICAHAACWMCFRYFSERYHAYTEIYPYQVTQLTTNLSYGRLLPSNGLQMEQIAEMFSRYGFYPLIYFREVWNRRGPDLFDRLLYCYIESGLPPVVGVPEHAVVAIGHTSDLNKPVFPGLTFSNHYLTSLIINDDNYLPYQKLPVDSTVLTGHVSTFLLSQVDSFVVPLPEKVYLSAEDVERLTLAVLKSPYTGLHKKSNILSTDELVLRTFLTSSRAYKEDRRRVGLPYSFDRIYTQLPMPRFIWVTELSTKDLFPKEQIVGEILWDATASGEDYYAWIAIHYPDHWLINDRNSHEAGISERHLPALVAYDMYRHNLHSVS